MIRCSGWYTGRKHVRRASVPRGGFGEACGERKLLRYNAQCATTEQLAMWVGPHCWEERLETPISMAIAVTAYCIL